MYASLKWLNIQYSIVRTKKFLFFITTKCENKIICRAQTKVARYNERGTCEKPLLAIALLGEKNVRNTT